MKREFTSVMIAMLLIAGVGATGAHAAPIINFVPPTPNDGATVVGTSVEIKAQIVEPSVASVTFNWNGAEYPIYDDSVVLMFNFDKVDDLGEVYSIPGGLVKDVSKYHNDGTVGIGNDPTTVPKWLQVGRYGGAFDFAGNGSTYGQSILVIPHHPSLDPYDGDFAIAIWVRPRSDIDGDILRKGSTYTASTWYKLEHSPSPSNNRFSLNFNTDGTDATVTSPQAYNDDQWHFVVAQRSGSTAELWIDGSLQGSAGVSGSISNTANLTVGSKDDQADDFINATLDEVRIYMRSFTADEIQMLYHSNLSKADQNTWYLYVNPSNLTSGTYTYQASATNTSSELSTLGRSVTMDAGSTPATIIKGPYLQQVTSDSIVIMWETDVAAGSRVDFGGTFVEDATPVTIHEVLLTGLAADAVYGYTVTSGATTSPAGTFATAPDVSRSFRFVAYGDTQAQPVEHAAVVQAIIGSAPEIVIQTGDKVSDGTIYEQWETQFFDPAYSLMINTPVLPTLSNHDYNASWFYNLFSLPNNEQWYAFTYGNIRFIGLNTCVSCAPGSAQYTWLTGEFQSAEYANATWHVAYFHHPPYTATSSHGDDANVKQYLVPLFEQNGMDMVFSGHSHAYERYFNNGIYYIVTGGGGAPLVSLVTDTQPPIRQVGAEAYHHCIIDVDVPGQSLTMSARYNDGTAFDTVELTKTSQATNPNPADAATGINVDVDLSWKAGIGALSHDVYFGTNPEPGAPEFKGNQTTTTYHPPVFLNYDTTYYWRIDEVGPGGTVTGDVWSFATRPSIVDDLANGEIPVDGTVTGDYTATQASDNSYEAITEIISGGGKNARSSLTHKWTINVTGGNTVTFYVEAHRPANSDGDDFVFAYSTDNVTYSDMVSVTNTSDESLTYVLPSSTTGTVYVRVQDSDRTRGNGSLDTVYVDQMFIRSSMASPPPAPKICVSDIAMAYQKAGANYSALATVWIRDDAEENVAGATVSGSWSGAVSGTSTGVTDSGGKVTLQSPKTKNGGTFTFTVTNVTASGYTYEPSLNVETSDSIPVP